MSEPDTRAGDAAAQALEDIAHALHLVTTDATQAPMGSLEALALEMRRSCDAIAFALHDIADALKGRRE